MEPMCFAVNVPNGMADDAGRIIRLVESGTL
jgi:hypothetical protein